MFITVNNIESARGNNGTFKRSRISGPFWARLDNPLIINCSINRFKFISSSRLNRLSYPPVSQEKLLNLNRKSNLATHSESENFGPNVSEGKEEL